MSAIDAKELEKLSLGSGAPKLAVHSSLTLGVKGPQLIADTSFIEETAHFNRERIPERVVHAKGAVVLGNFKVTNGNFYEKYCSAELFNGKGKKTRVTARFSQVGAETGAADTLRDIRGFAVKFYTESGNFDLVGNNLPVFFIRDSIKFVSLIHSQKRNPQTNLHDPNSFWDFVMLNEETWHAIIMMFSERGIPDGHRHMHGFGVNTYKLVNKNSEIHYAKFHWRCQQKIRNLEPSKASKLAGIDPDYSLRDIQAAINSSKPPSWTLHVQVIPEREASKAKFNPFDATKTWPHADYPLIEIGKMTLDKNVDNFFAQNEQLAFCPANLVPGIQAAYQDRLLAGRLFSYADAQRYRLGTNYQRMEVNKPINRLLTPTYRDGITYDDNFGSTPNYIPSSQFPNLKLSAYSCDGDDKSSRLQELEQDFTGQACRFDISGDDNYSQTKILYSKVLSSDSKSKLATSLGESLKMVTDKKIVDGILKQLENISEQLAKDTKKAIKKAT